MQCPWCSNTNFLPRVLCAHCNEELFPKPVTDEQTARHEKPPDDGERTGAGAAQWKSLAVSLCTAAGLGLGGVTSYHHWPVKPAPAQAVQDSAPLPDPAEELTAMNTFLQTVQSTRTEMPDTLGACEYAASDVELLAEVVQERTQQVSEATALRVDDIVDGGGLRQALISMTVATLTADKRYLTWARRAGSSSVCSDAGGNDAINKANQTAADAKRAFVRVWNADASRYGQPTYEWNDF
jgi:hypothetical protein